MSSRSTDATLAAGPCGRPFGCIVRATLVLLALGTCTVSSQLIGPGYVPPAKYDEVCFVPCKDAPNTDVPVPFTNCQTFYVCRQGRPTNKLACSGGRAFDVNIGACNHQNLVNCVDPECPPTMSPSDSPTESPSDSPTRSPTESPSDSPTESPTESPTPSPQFAMNFVHSKQSLIEQLVLKSYTSDGIAYPSIQYDFDGLFRGLQKMGADGCCGADFKFLLWNADEEKYKIGLVNLAAFLANAMAEGIRDDTCDELNWQQVAGRYALSNACGQEGRSYQDETCGVFSCIADPSLEITAVHSANAVRAPPPLECRPGSGASGYWDTNTGTEVKNTPYANTAGRIDVEGCCYWGRGVLITRGACNLGLLNYYLGARAAREGRPSLYPDLDFCVDPEAACASEQTKELRWTVSMFEWADRIQQYDSNGWAYEDELNKFYNNGMVDDSFIDTVSRVFYLGCHEAGCSDLNVRFMTERKNNFYVILNDVFGINAIKSTMQQPTPRPTPFPVAPLVITPRPVSLAATPIPTPRPVEPPMPQPPTLPTFYNPPSMQQFPPTLRPTPAPYPTTPAITPRPTVVTPKDVTEQPTYFDTLIPIEDNGGVGRRLYLSLVIATLNLTWFLR